MPRKFYMGVDFRRDHSLRIPRPDLSDKLETPNACTGCHDHAKESNAWAAEVARNWWGDPLKNHGVHYGEVLAVGRSGVSGSAGALARLVADLDKPALARATALSIIGRSPPDQNALNAAVAALGDRSPAVRAEAVNALAGVSPNQRQQFLAPLLADPVRAVRVATARVLADVPGLRADPAFKEAAQEFIAAQMAVSDRASGHMGLGIFYTDQGDPVQAEKAYRDAFRIEPDHIPSRINLAELLFQQNRVTEAGALLEEAVESAPEEGLAHEALGRHKVRTRDYEGALESLGKAAELMPDRASTQFFYGVALHSTNKGDAAIPPLQRAVELEPNNLEYLSGIATICRDLGRKDLARRYVEQLLRIQPNNPGFRALMEELQ